CTGKNARVIHRVQPEEIAQACKDSAITPSSDKRTTLGEGKSMKKCYWILLLLATIAAVDFWAILLPGYPLPPPEGSHVQHWEEEEEELLAFVGLQRPLWVCLVGLLGLLAAALLSVAVVGFMGLLRTQRGHS